ncbi:MAG: phage tail protein, partial [Hyphomicrobiaceae bacterium]
AMPTQVLVQAIIPASVAPATIRELALFTDDGQCLVVANYPATDLAATSQGAVNSIDVLIPIVVDTAADVTITINPATLIPLAQLMRAPFIAIDGFASAPPVNPAIGALVVAGPAISGAFANREDQFAQWTGVIWAFAPAPVDTIVGNAADHLYYRRTADGWVLFPLGQMPVADGEGVAVGGGFPAPLNLKYPGLPVGIPLNPDLFAFYSIARARHEVTTLENLIALIRTAVNYVATPPPVAENFAASGVNGTATSLPLASHITGGFASVALVNSGATGASMSGSTVTIPGALAAGEYPITYQATGPGGLSNVATITYTQAAYVAPPVASNFAASGANGTVNAINAGAHVAGAFTTIAIVADAGTGATVAGNNISVPANVAAGTYAITYRATGPGGVSNVATITLTQAGTQLQLTPSYHAYANGISSSPATVTALMAPLIGHLCVYNGTGFSNAAELRFSALSPMTSAEGGNHAGASQPLPSLDLQTLGLYPFVVGKTYRLDAFVATSVICPINPPDYPPAYGMVGYAAVTVTEV